MSKYVITILDSITETSMPFNEFILYRANHFKDEQQLLLVCNSPVSLPKVSIPNNLKIEFIGSNVLKWRGRISKILSGLERDSYAIHLHQAGPSMKILLAMLGTGFSNKVVFTVHSTFSGYQFHNKFRSYIDGLLSKYVVCCSNASYLSYPKSLKKLKGNNIISIQNGVDTDRIDATLEGKEKQTHQDVVFAYVARMIPLKNHDFLINVAKRASSRVQFLLIGKESKSIIQRIKAEGMNNRMEITGLIPRKEVFERLKDADVYLSTSTLEGLPVSVLEGMYAGMPALLSDIPQHREVASEKDFVKLVPFDEQQWVDEINRFASMSHEQLNRLGAESKAYVKENFSLAAMHNKYDVIYEMLRG